MDLKELMTTDVKVIHPDAILKDAAAIMDDVDVGALPVCDGDRLVGIITDRDIVIRSISAGQDPNSTRVRDAMTSPVIYCFEDQTVDEVAKMMEDKQIRRLPVLNRDKRLVGIVALGDIAVEPAEEKLGGEILAKVSESEKTATKTAA